MLTIYTGQNIATAAPMQPTAWEDVVARLRNDRKLAELVARLRRVRTLDRESYTRLKTTLPYFCTSQFAEHLRRTDHFEMAEAWVLDADHCAADDVGLARLKTRIGADPRVALCFVSPGGDGLKMLFILDEPCMQTKQFAEAYQAFAHKFAAEYDLLDSIDRVTHDVTRACFMSHDPQLYYNPIPDRVHWADYLPKFVPPPPTSPTLPFAEHPNESHDIRPDVYQDILATLKASKRPRPAPRPIHVPEALNYVLEVIGVPLAEFGINIEEVTNIQYGKRIRMSDPKHTAECNVFYGKLGFSVVGVPRRNYHQGLMELCVYLIRQALVP